MGKEKLFISYSHKDKEIRDELVPVLQGVSKIAEALWFDEQEIGIGDEFHKEIQQALAESRIAILLLSNHFFISDYIKQHELPFFREAAKRGERLACLYLTAIPKATLEQYPALKSRIGANDPNNPLNKLDEGKRDEIYAKLADWVAEKLQEPPPLPPHQGPRFELAVTMRKQRNHWLHSFSLRHAPDFTRPNLEYPPQEVLSEYVVTGEDLFQLLFGCDEGKSGEILGAAFGSGPTANPTRHPLRVHLLTDDDRLLRLPWANIAYRGRPLHDIGWTVELHAGSEVGFPEFPSHTCLFPGKVVLLASSDTKETAHFQDLQHFFQRGWQENPTPVLVTNEQDLQAELGAGSTRLVYYYGPASRDGLLLAGADGEVLPWTKLADLLQKTRSVSALFLNLLGESSRDAVHQGRTLLQGAKAVLFQCNERGEAAAAAKAGIDWLGDVFAGGKIDPVVALHRHRQGLVTAWTGYSTWRTVAPQRLENPDLVDLLLDRRSQRAELLQAKEDFYTFRARRIYHAVALGSQGCRVKDFPKTAGQHLKLYGRKDHEVIIHHEFPLISSLNNTKRIDDEVRRRLRIDPRSSIVSTLFRQEAGTSGDFWFLVLGWTLPKQVNNEKIGTDLIHAVTDWCHTRLSDDIAKYQGSANVRVISVLALEASDDIIAEFEDTVAELGEGYDEETVFHVGELSRLAGVRRQDLSHYFQDTQICNCDDRYRKDFPRRLLGDQREIPFDEAVRTIKRGEPDNWGNLFEELTDGR